MQRTRHVHALSELIAAFPVVGIVGPRQVGKSTIARQLAASAAASTWFDLEDDADLARLAEPRLALGDLRGLVVIDEIQHRPDLFPMLRVLADRPGRPATFVVLGSAAPALLRQGAESLAGRIAWYTLTLVGLDELPEPRRLHVRGGLPPSVLADNDGAAATWLSHYVVNLTERDLQRFGIDLAPVAARRFWTMLAHLHGGLLNVAELSRSFGIREPEVRRHLDVLTGALLVRQLQPWHENVGKRLVRSPKVYIADTGVLHALLGLRDPVQVESHPKLGLSWEWFALQQVVERLGVRLDDVAFWATHGGAELDLFVPFAGKRLGFEFKRTSAPERTKSMHIAMQDLQLDRLYVVHAGTASFPMAPNVDALAIGDVWTELPRLA